MNKSEVKNTAKKTNAGKNKAIFLDRDGTINQDFGYVYKLSDLKILDGVKKGLKELKKLGYKLIIITNQSGIGRGYYTLEDCNKFNEELEKQIGIKFDAVYVCPHISEDNCGCRKPGILSVEKAIKNFNLDIRQCYFVGDKESDIQTGINAGCKTVLMNYSPYECNLTPDYSINNLYELVKIIK